MSLFPSIYEKTRDAYNFVPRQSFRSYLKIWSGPEKFTSRGGKCVQSRSKHKVEGSASVTGQIKWYKKQYLSPTGKQEQDVMMEGTFEPCLKACEVQ